MVARLAPALQSFLELPAERRRIGPFHLVEQLGKGGFAPVWLAEEVYGTTKLRTAAVKIFSFGDGRTARDPARRESGEAAQRREQITEEARALCRVEHPNVVRFYSLPTDDERGLIGLAMEYVAGVSLDRRLAGDKGATTARVGDPVRGLELDDVLGVGLAVASALAVVHQAGLVHRDIKPANVIESGGVYKLIDFGIASAERPRAPETSSVKPASGLGLGADDTAKVQSIVIDDIPIQAIGTQASMLKKLQGAVGEAFTSRITSGTIGYIDPQCMPPRSLPATAASDLYGLGAMLFECLTGYVPAVVAARPTGGLKAEVLDGRARAPALHDVVPSTPASLCKLVDALLDPDREARPRSAEAVARELERIRGEVAGSERALPPESIGPFRGLGRFEEADRDVHFGRAAEVAATVERLRGRGVVALVGPSGSGKSSLARAGVLPAIADGALGAWPKAWDRVVITPGSDPWAALGAAIAPYAGPAARSPEAIVASLAERAQTEGRGFVLLLDQLEELATHPYPDGPAGEAMRESRARAVELITRFGDQALAGVRLLVAARRDLLDPILALGNELGRTLTRGVVLVSPIGDAAWSDVLDQALAAYGYSFEDAELRETIIADLRNTASAMPLVEFALTQLWDQRDVAHKRITRAGFRAIGGISGALERHADATLATITRGEPSLLAGAKELLLALTTAQGTRTTRSMEALVAQVGPHAAAIARGLEEARLLVREREGVAIAHEALLTQWGQLRSWLAEAREDRVLAEEIERDAARWGASRDPSLLWRKRRLLAAEDLRRRGSVRLSADAERYLAAGRRDERLGRVSLGVGAMVALAAALIVGVNYVHGIHAARELAEQKAAEAHRSEELAKESMHKQALEAERADLASAEARRAAESADEAKRDFEQRLNELRAELKKNLNDAKALQELAKHAAAMVPAGAGSTGPTIAPPIATGASVSQTGLPP